MPPWNRGAFHCPSAAREGRLLYKGWEVQNSPAEQSAHHAPEERAGSATSAGIMTAAASAAGGAGGGDHIVSGEAARRLAGGPSATQCHRHPPLTISETPP